MTTPARTLYRALCRLRGDIMERRFDGRGFRLRDLAALWLLEVPMEAIEVWQMRHLWHPRTWQIFRKDDRHEDGRRDSERDT